jgi:capsular polysaccharide biosynthesis protein
MDLRMHAAVIWRWRSVVFAGLALAIVLTFFSVFKVSFAQGFSVKYRQGKTWQSAETLLLSQRCSVIQPNCSANQSSEPSAPLFAQIANSGLVRAKVFPGGQATAATGDYLAFAVTDSSTGNQQLLPFLEFDGTGSAPAKATQIARRATTQFLSYLNEAADRDGILPQNRVIVQIVSPATADTAKVVKGRKLTVPILVLLATLIVTLGLAYLLENLFPRAESVASPKPRLESVVDSPNGAEAAALEPVEPVSEPNAPDESVGARPAARAKSTRIT